MEVIIDHATKYIKNALILNNVNLSMCGGHIYGFQGPNGSGKTMLMRLVAGLIRPSSGTISVGGKQLGKDIDFPDSIGMLLENPAFLPGYTGFQNLEFLAAVQRKIGEKEIKNALCDVGLLPEDKRKYRKYSLGMKQRLGVAAAIMEKPEVILLDEPTNALDDDGVAQICNLIQRERDRGAVIMLACHDKEVLESLSDEIFTVSDGVIQKKVP